MLATKFYELHGVRVLELPTDGTKLRTYNDAVELIGKSFENRATLIVIPVECLDDEFFRLKTRIAGELIQKFVQYRRRFVIVGDISRHLAESSLCAHSWPNRTAARKCGSSRASRNSTSDSRERFNASRVAA